MDELNSFDPNEVDIEKGCTILVNKPLDWTSFDVVNKLRGSFSRYFEKRRLKVGHAGTLDPKATGLLIVCLGRHTKRIHSFQGFEKSYTGTIELGKTTPTYDRESSPDAFYEVTHITDEILARTSQKFVGKIKQVPPQYSALKVDGKVAYKAARAGKEIKLEAREVEVKSFELSKIHMPYVDFTVICSKGTYIRSLAFDFGKALNSGAYLYSLCRISIGPFNLSQAYEIEEIVRSLEKNRS